MPNYYIKDAKEDDKCWDCGQPATIVLVAEDTEKDTGYVDDLPLCEDCAERREV